MASDEEWERWKARLLGILLSLIAVGVLVREFFMTDQPSETRIVAALGLLGLPAVLGAAGKIGKDKP